MGKVNCRAPLEMSVLDKLVDRECPALKQESRQKTSRGAVTQYFLKTDLHRKTLCMCAVYFSWSLIYFGLGFNVKNLAGDLYRNVFYLGIADAVGFKSALLILDRIGRRMFPILSISGTSVFLVALAIGHLTIDIALAFCGRFGEAVGRSCIWAQSSEAFPTSIRAVGAGQCGISLALGGIVTGQLAYLGATSPSVPFFTFAIIGVAGSLCALLIPETSGQPLEESIQRPVRRGHAPSIISTITNFVMKHKNNQKETNDESQF